MVMRQYIKIVESIQVEEDAPRGHVELPGKPSTEMTEKKVLYRSVSLPELASIWESGAVTGGQNSFNEFDTRKWVFFGDSITPYLTWQGEDVERWAVYSLKNDPIQVDFRILQREYDEGIETLSEVARAALEKLSNAEAHALYLRLEADWKDREAVSAAKRFLHGTDAATYRNVQIQISDALKDLDELRKEWREKYKEKLAWFKEWRTKFPITSAIIRTKPVDGGFHYASKTKEVDDEYGMPPGHVTFFDIDLIYLVKDKEVVGEIDPYDLGKYLQKIGLETNK